MNGPTKLITMGLLAALSALFQRCTHGWSSFHVGMVEGKRYEVQTRSVSDYFSSTSSIEYRLRFGDLPYLPINANTTDWDVVYSTDIFGKDSFDYITTKDTAYSNTEKIGERTFLYLLPDDVTRQAYDAYVLFFTSDEWQKANHSCIQDTKDGKPFPHIVGLVHGDPSRYTQEFKGIYLDQEYIFRVENDGRVRLMDKLGEIGTGLSPKVQMPDKIIYFLSPSSGGITTEDLRNFKNEQGKSPLEYFTFLHDEKALK
jgi:hypothetical protein